MAVHQEANWGTKTGPGPHENGVAERANHFAHVAHPALSRLPKRSEGSPRSNIDPCPTIEIVSKLAEARNVTVVAVTSDPELRAALTEVLPKEAIVFSDSPEQLLASPVPNNCAVLIVEQTLSRATFEQLKSHLKASAPALVNIMVGTHNDGSGLVGLLSAGYIDRFMVKPFNLGPTRTALRSALQQHHSLRSNVQIDRAKPEIHSADSAPCSADDRPSDRKVRIDKPKIAAVTTQPVNVRRVNVAAPADQTKIESSHVEPARAAPTPRKLPPPSWSLAFAAIIAATGLIMWVMSARAPEGGVDKAFVNKTVASYLAAAQRAFELGSYIDPPELSATHFYNAALEIDPSNAQARSGLDAVADRLIADGKQFIVAGDLLRAQSTLDSVRRIKPNHRELSAVTAALLAARDTERQTIQAAHTAGKPNLEQNAAVAPPVAASTAAAAKKVTVTSPIVASTRAAKSTAAAPIAASAVAANPAANSSPVAVKDTSPLQESQPSQELTKREEARVIDPAQDEAAVRAAPKVAAVAATMTADSIPSNAGPNAASQSVTGQAVTGQAVAGQTATGKVAAAAVPKGLTNSVGNGQLVLIKYVPPEYPYGARSQRTEGWLDVYFTVTSDGRVIKPHVENGTLGPKFHRAAFDAVTQWKFSRAANGDRPDHQLSVRLEFRVPK